MQLKEDGLSCWRTVGGLSRHHRSLWRMTAGSGWRSCPGGPAWSHWVDQRAPSSAVQDLQLWVQTLYWVLPAFVNHLDPAVSGHPVLLLPITKTEPESLSGDETDVSDSHVEGVSVPVGRVPGSGGKECVWTDTDMISLKEVHGSSFQERTHSSFLSTGRSVEVSFTPDVAVLELPTSQLGH